MPGHADFAAWIAGLEEADELGPAVVVEAFVGLREEPPAPVQRVVLAASVAERVVLHPAPALIHRGVGDLDQMERIRDLPSGREHRVEDFAIGTGQIQRGPLDRVEPGFRAAGQPGDGWCGVSAFDHVEQDTSSDVNDRCRPVLAATLAAAHEQCLVEAECVHVADAVRIVEERFAVGLHGVVHGVPIATELVGDVAHRPAVQADLKCHPPPGAVRQRQPRWCDFGDVQRPRVHRTRCRVAAPAVLTPQQPRSSSEHREIDQQHRVSILDLRRRTTAETGRSWPAGLDHDRDALTRVLNAEHGHVGQTNEQLAHARSIRFHRGTSIWPA